MAGMFKGAIVFNQDISSWNVSSVIDMRSMFDGALVFDKDITIWTGVAAEKLFNRVFSTELTNFKESFGVQMLWMVLFHGVYAKRIA